MLRARLNLKNGSKWPMLHLLADHKGNYGTQHSYTSVRMCHSGSPEGAGSSLDHPGHPLQHDVWQQRGRPVPDQPGDAQQVTARHGFL